MFKRNVHVSPFWEEDLPALAELIGADQRALRLRLPAPRGPGRARPATSTSSTGAPTTSSAGSWAATWRRLMGVDDAVLRRRRIPALLAATVGAARRPAGGRRRRRDAARGRRCDGAARDFAAGLVDAGIGPGDRVAMWAPERVAVDRRRPRPVHGRGDAGADQHPVQGGRGRGDPRAQRRVAAADHPDVPRHRLRRHARRRRWSRTCRSSSLEDARCTGTDARRGRPAGCRPDRRRRRPTSSSPRGRPACPRAW